MFVEILFLIFGAFYLVGKDAKYRQKIKECQDSGAFVETNRELENGFYKDYCFRYEFESQKDVPEKYHKFFRFNSRAMYDYFMDLAARDVWKQGYRPYLFGIMPKEGFDFLAGFRKKYDARVDEFNKHCEEMRSERFVD